MNGSSRVRLVAETGSTNADLMALAANGTDWPEGQWLRAVRQTSGRGRLGRSWEGQDGNLHASTLIRLRHDDPPVSGLGLLVGVALFEAASGFDATANFSLKWPNDLMAGRAKVGGILLERSGNSVVAGVGVNVASAPEIPGRETCAMRDLPGSRDVTAEALADALAERFDVWLGIWRQDGFTPLRRKWLAAAHPRHTAISVGTGPDSRIEGKFEGLAEDGALLLLCADGHIETIHSGDVGFL